MFIFLRSKNSSAFITKFVRERKFKNCLSSCTFAYYANITQTSFQKLIKIFCRSDKKEFLTRDRLILFLNDEQRDPRLNEILFPFFDHERVQQLIAKYETDESYINQGKMSTDGFFRFLMQVSITTLAAF